jgi:PAS domain S-box-containing protein
MPDSPPTDLDTDPHVYEQCFRDSTDAIVITDKFGKILSVNHAWQNLYGFTQDEVRGKSTSIIKSEHTDADMYRHMWSQISDDAAGHWKGEIVNRKRNGEEVPVMLTITPIRQHGEIVGYMGIGIDISDRKNFEEFRRLYDMVVRHDLKSPLNSIIQVGRALAEGYIGPLSAGQQDMVERLLAQADRMQAIIATSIDLEKLKQSKLHLDPEPTNVVELVRNSIQILNDFADRKSLSVELRIGVQPAAADSSFVRTLDPLHFQRCTDNLIKNALEAAVLGSTVTISIFETDCEWFLRIHNFGPPIPPDIKATLFHPFSTYGKRSGTGLGIYGVKLTVEAMGGLVRYASSDENGTTFELAFPL